MLFNLTHKTLMEEAREAEQQPAAGGAEAEPSEPAGGSEGEGEAPTSSDFDWGDFSESIDGDHEGDAPPAEAERQEPESEEPAAEQPAAEEPTQEPEPAEEPAAAQQEEEAPAQQEEPQAEEEAEKPQERTPEEIQQELEQFYGLDKDDVREIQANPEETIPKILPKLAARLHMTIQQQMAEGLKQHLPAMMDQYTQSKQQSAQAVDKFYERWPQLRGQDQQTVAKFARAYREAHPKATQQELIENVGSMAMVALKIPFEQQKSDSGQSAARVESAPRPARPAPQGPSTPRGGAAPSQDSNPFTTIAEEMMRD